MSSSRPESELHGVRLTSPDRVLFEEQGITKRTLAEYYASVAHRILPHLEDRPLTLLRCPRGQGESCFVQRRADEGFPETLRRIEIPDGDGPTTYLSAESVEGLIGLVQLGVLELHTWGSRRDRLDRPDRLILDLDPGPEVPFGAVVDAALRFRDRLEALGLRSFAKTTGGKGLHVVVPLVRRHGWDDVREFARALAEEAEREDPGRFLAHADKKDRAGRIFVDYLRNGWSASSVAPYSTRARRGAPVSVPLDWSEVAPGLDPADFDVRTVPARAERSDPWAELPSVRQSLRSSAAEALRGAA